MAWGSEEIERVADTAVEHLSGSLVRAHQHPLYPECVRVELATGHIDDRLVEELATELDQQGYELVSYDVEPGDDTVLLVGLVIRRVRVDG